VGALENCLPILDRLGAKEDIAVARELLRQPGEVVRGSSRPTTEGRGVLDGVRLASLLEVGQRLSATLDPDALLQQILASAVKVLGAERGILYLAEGVDNQLVARSTHGAADAPATLSVAQEVWRTGVGSLLADAQIDPRFAGAASVVSSGVRSILCVPLSFKSRTLGVLYLDSRLVSGIFTRADLDLLQALASYAAVALENTRAFHALEQSRSDLEIMHEASRRLGAELEQAKVLQTLLEEAIRLAQARGGGIVTSEGEQPRLRLQRGLETPKIQAIVRALPTWRLSRAESTVEDLCGDDRALVQPLWAGGRHVGALFVVGAASAERAGRLIAPLCTQASMALRNAELYELAVTDGLTRLFQRRYFDQALDRLVRARAEPVSVVIADLDDFKPVNDRYGHAAGDEVLRKVAQVLREHVRITDIPSRLGGDEFGVILPDTGKEEGLRVLRKLREAFHGATVSVAGTTLSVGASFGLACSDETADTTELLALADKRLYEAKQAAKMAG
jgi:diguanylate cyclase (GGDEF)-like protein